MRMKRKKNAPTKHVTIKKKPQNLNDETREKKAVYQNRGGKGKDRQRNSKR
eukprot:m.146050 g.146050  ORF g.146050 m.146050 type:complete len:51 (-) comp30463_c5_seq1:326-478(-)